MPPPKLVANLLRISVLANVRSCPWLPIVVSMGLAQTPTVFQALNICTGKADMGNFDTWLGVRSFQKLLSVFNFAAHWWTARFPNRRWKERRT